MRTEDLDNLLKRIQGEGYLQNMTLTRSDSRTGDLISLVERIGSAFRTKSPYYSRKEMGTFLYGYLEAKTNNLN